MDNNECLLRYWREEDLVDGVGNAVVNDSATFFQRESFESQFALGIIQHILSSAGKFQDLACEITPV